MERRRLLGIACVLIAFALAILALFSVYFQPHVLTPYLGRTWVDADGTELGNWPPFPGANRCPHHRAYHHDGVICLDQGGPQ